MGFIPDYLFNRIWDISPELLKNKGVSALILDIDNTLTFDGDADIPPEAARWLSDIKKAGIKAAIVSNNSEKRVGPFAEKCGLSYVASALKPSKAGFVRSRETLGADAASIAVIGDQLFTDIAFGKRFGCLTILVERMGPDKPLFVKSKRLLEWLFMKYVRKNRGVK